MTIERVLEKYSEAEKINPAFERVISFSWDDMLLLKREIENLRNKETANEKTKEKPKATSSEATKATESEATKKNEEQKPQKNETATETPRQLQERLARLESVAPVIISDLSITQVAETIADLLEQHKPK